MSRQSISFFILCAFALTLGLSVSSCSPHHRDGSSGEVNLGTSPLFQGDRAEAGERVPGYPGPEDALRAAVDLRDSGKKALASQLLKGIRRTFPDTAWSARASFVLGRMALDSGGDAARAEELFRAAGGLTDVEDYVLFLRARAFEQLGEKGPALALYHELTEARPGSVLAARAVQRKAVLYEDLSAHRKARRAYREFVSDYPEDDFVPEALLGVVRTSVALDDEAAALSAASTLYTRHPSADETSEAAPLVDMEALSKDLPPEELYTRAVSLLRAGRFEEASDIFRGLSESGELRHRASLMSAVSRVRMKDYPGAEEALRDYLDGQGPLEKAPQALYWLAVTALRQGKDDLLAEAEERLAADYPRSGKTAEVLIITGDRYRARGELDQARARYRKVLEGRGSDLKDEALWRLGWMAYTGGEFEEARSLFSRVVRLPEPERVDKFIYWSARAAERLGDLEAAARTYQRIRDGFVESYYSVMAEERLKALSRANPGDTTGREPTARKLNVPDALYSDPHYRASKELLVLGMYTEASQEASILLDRHSGDRGALYELARVSYRAGDFHTALKVYMRHFYGQRGPAGGLAPGEFAIEELSFPPRLVEKIRRLAPDGGADPRLVAAVMREESSFDPRVISRTGAVGLMQIMPSTGRFIARNMGEPFDEKDLLDPETNIRLGAWYLGHLSKRFDRNVVFTVAGYNAGPGAVRRWAEKLPAEPDEFIESIPYPETRYYAKRVVRSYAEFLRTAGGGESTELSSVLAGGGPDVSG